MKEPERIWEAALGELQLQVNKPNFDTWLKNTRGLSLNDDLFVVGTPSAFAAEWLQNRMYSLIKNALANVLGELVEVQFTVIQPSSHKELAPSLADGGLITRAEQRVKTLNLNPKFTFESFISGESNMLAFRAARDVAQNPGRVYNPLYIYSDTGLGKTHLLHAIGHELKNNKNVLCVSAEQLTSEFISAVKKQQTEELNRKYRNADILLLDDFQFICGKRQTQEYFFHLFNELYENECQIVITCDNPPKCMMELGSKMCSRLECGLVADIKPPEYEMRLAILKHRTSKAKMDIPVEVLEFIAANFRKNIRELEGGLNRVMTYARMKNSTPDLELARSALAPLLASDTGNHNGASRLAHQNIIDAVAGYFGISPKAITGKSRERNTTQARHIAMYILREYGNLKLDEIGKLFGNRDHSTVLYSYNKISEEMNVDKQLEKLVQDICRELNINSSSKD